MYAPDEIDRLWKLCRGAGAAGGEEIDRHKEWGTKGGLWRETCFLSSKTPSNPLQAQPGAADPRLRASTTRPPERASVYLISRSALSWSPISLLTGGPGQINGSRYLCIAKR